MDYELHGNRNYQTPVENTCRWLLSVKFLERLVETEHHENNRDTKAEVCGLVISHLNAI